MGRTRHYGRRGSPDLDSIETIKRRARGYEYWGKDASRGADHKKITKTRRIKRKQDARWAEDDYIENTQGE